MTFWKSIAAHTLGTLLAALVILVVGRASHAIHVSWADVGKFVGLTLLVILLGLRLVAAFSEVLVRTVEDVNAAGRRLRAMRRKAE